MTKNRIILLDAPFFVTTFDSVLKAKKVYKRLIMLLCLMAYSLGLLKPFATVVAYTCNIEYISSTLCVQKNETNNCCKGKCYLTDQLKKEAKEESQQKVPTVKTIQEEIVVENAIIWGPQQSMEVQFAGSVYGTGLAHKHLFVPPPQTLS